MKEMKNFNIAIAAGLFILQIFHLYWLTTTVVTARLFDLILFHPSAWFESVLIFVDFLEIPTLIAVSLIYISELRKKNNGKSLLYLIFLNSQWLHIFWITDEFVVEKLTGAGAGTILPIWLAWLAIFIDYLELPVIYDTLIRFRKSFRTKGLRVSLSEIRENS